MAKLNLDDMMGQFDEMDSMMSEAEDAKKDMAVSSMVDQLQALLTASFASWYSTLSYDISNVYLKGRTTKVSENNFIKMIAAMAPAIHKDDIVVLRDTTISGSDEGMIITTDKVYYKTSSGKGEINLVDIKSIYTKRGWGGNTVDITTTHGDVCHLGQVACLKDELTALDKAFRELIAGINQLKNEQ